MVHKLAGMIAAERRRIIGDFVDAAFEGIAPEAPGARVATFMRQMPAELPAEPSVAQVEAWWSSRS